MEKNKQKNSLKRFFTDKFLPLAGLITPFLLIFLIVTDGITGKYDLMSAHSLALLFFAIGAQSNDSAQKSIKIARKAMDLNNDTLEMCQDLQDVVNNKMSKAELQDKWGKKIDSKLTADELFNK